MSQPIEIVGFVFKNFSAVLVARVVGSDNSTPLVQSDVDAAEYSIYLIDPNDPDNDTVVEGHDGVSLTVSEVIYNTLQTDDLWDVPDDDAGYNFKLVIDVSQDQAFAKAGAEYRIVVTLDAATGQDIPIRARARAQ